MSTMTPRELAEEIAKLTDPKRINDCSISSALERQSDLANLIRIHRDTILAALELASSDRPREIAERGQWVKCEERLPEESGLYLTIRFPGDHGSDLPFDAGSKGWNCFAGRFSELFPTHWMPLPLPPEEK